MTQTYFADREEMCHNCLQMAYEALGKSSAEKKGTTNRTSISIKKLLTICFRLIAVFLSL